MVKIHKIFMGSAFIALFLYVSYGPESTCVAIPWCCRSPQILWTSFWKPWKFLRVVRVDAVSLTKTSKSSSRAQNRHNSQNFYVLIFHFVLFFTHPMGLNQRAFVISWCCRSPQILCISFWSHRKIFRVARVDAVSLSKTSNSRKFPCAHILLCSFFYISHAGRILSKNLAIFEVLTLIILKLSILR